MIKYKNINSSLKISLEKEIKKNITGDIKPGEDYIPVTGKLIDPNDLLHGIDATIDGWLTSGRYSKQFENDFKPYFK